MKFSITPIKVFLLLLAFAFTGSAFSQSLENYADGTIITTANETLSVKLRIVSEDRLGKFVTMLENDNQTQKRLSTKDIVYFRYNDGDEYFAKPFDKKLVFMKRIIAGTASLYEYSFKERKGGKSELIGVFFAEKEAEEKFTALTKRDFRNEILPIVGDCETLSEKIETKYYTYAEKEAVIEEYNDWVKQGRPGKTWTREEGNFTRPEKEYETETAPPVRKSYSRDIEGSRIGIDIPLLATYSFVNYPDELNAAVRTESGGFGYNLGLGIRYNILKSLVVRAGVNFKVKRFHSQYYVQETGDTTNTQYLVDERGDINYLGMYAMLNYETQNFFMGAGLDFAFGSFYSAKRRITNANTGTIMEGNENTSESFLTDAFNLQVDLNLSLGYKVNLLNNQLKLKPVFQYSIPLINMFDLNPPLETYGISGYLIQLGLIVDVGFTPKKKFEKKDAVTQ